MIRGQNKFKNCSMTALKLTINIILFATIFLKSGSEYCFANGKFAFVNDSIKHHKEHCENSSIHDHEEDSCHEDVCHDEDTNQDSPAQHEYCCIDIKTGEAVGFMATNSFVLDLNSSSAPKCLANFFISLANEFQQDEIILNRKNCFKNPLNYDSPPLTRANTSHQFTTSILLQI